MLKVLLRSVASCFLLPQAAAQTPRVELDHVYIVVKSGGVSEIAALKSAGFQIAPPRQHDGEGTTSVAAFFDNAYIELMWLDSTLSVTPELDRTRTDGVASAPFASRRWSRNHGSASHGTIEHQPSKLSVIRPARIETRTAPEPLLEIYLDGGGKKSRTDLRPALPVVIIR